MPKVFKKRLFNQRGITLIELIAVILILGIIAAVGIPVVFNQISQAEEQADIANVAIVNEAVERYAIVNSGYPTYGSDNDAETVEGLITFLKGADNDGPYLSSNVDITFNGDVELVPATLTDGDEITGIKLTE